MNTLLYPLFGTLFTFLMTTLGSALVFFFKDEIKDFYNNFFYVAGRYYDCSLCLVFIDSFHGNGRKPMVKIVPLFRWRIYHWSFILAFFRSCDSSSTLK